VLAVQQLFLPQRSEGEIKNKLLPRGAGCAMHPKGKGGDRSVNTLAGIKK
jgi:hypothetical protein